MTLTSAESRSPSPDAVDSSSAAPPVKDNEGSDDEVWDPAAETKPREKSTPPSEETAPTTTATAPSTDWQAIWSAAHGAYYFYNSVTQVTTWTNPLAPSTGAAELSAETPSSTSAAPSTSAITSASASIPSTSTSSSLPASRPLPTADQLGGIDPELAFLDPSLAYGGTKTGGGPVPTFAAKFNARSGRFAGGDARDPSHISEYERAKRMSEAYFDVDSWKKQVEERENERKRAAEEDADGGGKRKRPTKADLVSASTQPLKFRPLICAQERFKEQRKEKKMKKIAWLRE